MRRQAGRSGRRYGGAGLGLAFVKRIAKQMGGDLTLTSHKGGGSSFHLAILVDAVSAAAARGDETGRQAVPSRPLRLLCAEDNPYGRVVLNTILTELGHRADFVGSGEAVVAAAARGGYDAVLMDVTLSGIDGLEATRRIRALAQSEGRVPIVGISGRAHAGDEAAGRAAGMDFYLAKPISPRALNSALGRLTARD